MENQQSIYQQPENQYYQQQQNIVQSQSHRKYPTVFYLLFGGTALSCFSYFEKADYNIGIYPFLLLLLIYPNEIMDFPKHLVRIVYLIIFSLIFDLFWLIYWNNKYNIYLDDFDYKLSWMAFPIHWTIVLSFVQFCLKIAIIYFLYTEEQFRFLQREVSIDTFFEQITQFFGFGGQETQNQDQKYLNQQNQQDFAMQNNYQQYQASNLVNQPTDQNVTNKKQYTNQII